MPEPHLLRSILSFDRNVLNRKLLPAAMVLVAITFFSVSLQLPDIHPKPKHLTSPQHTGASLNLLEECMMWWLPNLGGFHGATANGGRVVLTLASSRPQQYAAFLQASV